MKTEKAGRLKLGCPVWAHSPWMGSFFTSDAKRSDFLPQYASVFNAVEGNSSFYGLPSADTIKRWCDEAPDGFEFCFKFPRVVSHDLLLRNAERETLEFIDRLEPLGKRLGSFFLQLPPHFEHRHLDNLTSYVQKLPNEFHYAVEVRNPCFFRQDPVELAFNQTLSSLEVDRVVFDTRALFAGDPGDEDTRDAVRKKPNLPVAKCSTSSRPFIRFVGHPDEEVTDQFLNEWVEPVLQWLDQGKQPYFFTHMPDDLLAPHLGRRFLRLLQKRGLQLDVPQWPGELEPEKPKQMDLFA